ncbi:MAG: uridine kinase [Actinomycetota bacterium]|nr:uridine kinase [Actinomycetota bacterium]
MARWAPERRDTLKALAEELLQHYAHGRVVVAVDGADGAGKTVFSDDLATELRGMGHTVFRASMDDFHQPRALRYAKGRESAQGFYEDSYDYPTFRRVLLGPFRMAGATGFCTEFFDLARDVPFESRWQTGPADAILIVDGIFLLRPELAGIWNFSIWLDATDDVRRERMIERDGSHPEFDSPLGQRYLGGQELYQLDASPRTAASAIIDNTDVDHPRRQFADSC